MLGAAVKQSIDECVLCWLATANADGEPSVSPKELFVAHGDEGLLIANIASPNSVANIRQNSAVCVSFVDVFKQKGFKIRGSARIVEDSEPRFELLLRELHKLGGEGFPVRSIIEVTVAEAEPTIAPSYWLFPDTTEQDQVTQAMDTYGVQPRD